MWQKCSCIPDGTQTSKNNRHFFSMVTMRVHLEPWVTSSQGCKLHCRAHQSLAGDISRVNSWMPKTHRCHFAPCEIVIIFNKEERWYIFICHERWLPPFIRLSTFYMSPEKITHFICRKIGFFVCREKYIRALCTKNFCASNAAIRKILGFLASGFWPPPPCPTVWSVGSIVLDTCTTDTG